MTAVRELELKKFGKLEETVDLLHQARLTGRTLEDLPVEHMPADLSEIYFVQDRLAACFGEIGGWKIGATDPQATPTFAPMPLAWVAPSGSTLSGTHWRYRGLEAEIAFLVGRDLPPRATPYSRDEALAAMASCHPAIEVLETAFSRPAAVPREAMLADLQLHGGFVYGPAFPDWRTLDFTTESVCLTVDGVIRVERTGSNTAGDLLRLIPWLTNEGAARSGGLRAGQWITTGSWTGNTPAESNSSVMAEFTEAGRVDLRFA